jgi:serine/threonine protein kinase
VKPSNILLRADGSPVLTDFGLAVALAEVARVRRLTPSNVIVGTADYLSPEQIAGGMVDGRADIYSLGVVLYEMLSGYVPFAGRDPMDTLKAHLEEPPPALPEDVPIGARAIVDKALKKRPDERFPSAAEMKAALDETIK